ncbi:DUF2029 domain-containing protein [Candidatus Poribacteria bacterium]|nr:DUF2029 domain-containing protein [Candidatus Poribacteria bacterium]
MPLAGGRRLFQAVILLSICLMLWNVASFLFDIPVSVPNRLFFHGLDHKAFVPMDLEVNYATAHMVAHSGFSQIYDYRTMQYHGHGLALRSDNFLYPEIAPRIFQRYISTPFSIFLYLPLTLFSFDTAYKIWVVGSAILFSATLVILLRGKSLEFVALALLTCSFFLPMQADLLFGQTNTILLFLLALFLFLLEKRQDLAASAIWALMIQIKVIPAIWGLYFLRKRKYRFLLLSALFVGLLCLFPLALLGSKPLVFFVKEVFPTISSGNFHYFNHGLYGFVGRLFYAHGPLGPSEGINGMLDSRAVYVSKLLSVGILLVVWFLTKREYITRDLPENNEVSLYVLTMLLISPVTWFHYLMILLIPFFLMLGDTMGKGKHRFLTGALFIACFSAINVFPFSRKQSLVLIRFVALSALWLFFAFGSWQDKIRCSEKPQP